MAGEETRGARAPGELRNPTLGRGEIFREEIKLDSGGGAGYDPQTPAEVRYLLGSRAAAVAREATERTAAELGSSGRIVVEAKVLPYSLAANHTAYDLIDASGMAIVGTRPARGEYRTPTRVQADAPAKVYLLSGTPADAAKLATFLQAETPTPENVYDQLRQLTGLELGGPETVIDIDDQLLEYDDDGRAQLEAVLHPQVGEQGTGDHAAQERNIEAFRHYVTSLDDDARLSAVAIEDGVAFLSLIVSPAAIPAVARYTQLRVLRPLTVLREPPVSAEDESWALERIVAAITESDERIAIFDGDSHPS